MRPALPQAVYPGEGDHYTPFSDRRNPPFGPIASYEPRGLASSGLYQRHPYPTSMTSPPPQNGQDDCSKFPWPNLEIVCELYCAGRSVTPDIKAQVEKGFFQDPVESKWTCYRRNYFSVTCNYNLTSISNNAQLYIKRGGNQEVIKAIAMRISAAVDGPNGKSIELVQHTPKRDAGPKLKITPVRMLPAPTTTGTDAQIHTVGHYATQMVSFHQTGQGPAPFLSMQFIVEPDPQPEPQPEPSGSNTQASNAPAYNPPPPSNQGTTTHHTFERIQFKCATANNGKRRASQQYFHLIAEIVVDIRKEGANQPSWQTVAKRTSEKIVVRGRSPSHYQNEGGGAGNGRNNAGAGGRYGAAAAALSPGVMFSPIGQQLRSHVAESSTAGAAMSYHSSGYTPSISFRPHSQYPIHESSGESASSPESVTADAFDADHSANTMMSTADRGGIHDMDGYSYHPSPMYDTIHHHLPMPVPKTEGIPRISTDPRQHAFKADFPEGTAGPQWHMQGPFGRYQGFESSKNVFPDVTGGAGSYS